MTAKTLGISSITASLFAIGCLLSTPHVKAAPAPLLGTSETVCVPYHPSPDVNDQKCTRTFYDSSGNVIGTNVYYIREDGTWYILP